MYPYLEILVGERAGGYIISNFHHQPKMEKLFKSKPVLRLRIRICKIGSCKETDTGISGKKVDNKKTILSFYLGAGAELFRSDPHFLNGRIHISSDIQHNGRNKGYQKFSLWGVVIWIINLDPKIFIFFTQSG